MSCNLEEQWRSDWSEMNGRICLSSDLFNLQFVQSVLYGSRTSTPMIQGLIIIPFRKRLLRGQHLSQFAQHHVPLLSGLPLFWHRDVKPCRRILFSKHNNPICAHNRVNFYETMHT
jgi:hypothetical protein